MLTSTPTGRALQTLCLSMWMCCLPALTACCACCEILDCDEACCQAESSQHFESGQDCQHSHNAHLCHRAQQQPRPCACTCCPLRMVMVPPPASAAGELLETNDSQSLSTYLPDGETDCAAVIRKCQRDLSSRCCARPLDRCSRLCRFTI